jgi:hypothetical protein
MDEYSRYHQRLTEMLSEQNSEVQQKAREALEQTAKDEQKALKTEAVTTPFGFELTKEAVKDIPNTLERLGLKGTGKFIDDISKKGIKSAVRGAVEDHASSFMRNAKGEILDRMTGRPMQASDFLRNAKGQLLDKMTGRPMETIEDHASDFLRNAKGQLLDRITGRPMQAGKEFATTFQNPAFDISDAKPAIPALADAVSGGTPMTPMATANEAESLTNGPSRVMETNIDEAIANHGKSLYHGLYPEEDGADIDAFLKDFDGMRGLNPQAAYEKVMAEGPGVGNFGNWLGQLNKAGMMPDFPVGGADYAGRVMPSIAEAQAQLGALRVGAVPDQANQGSVPGLRLAGNNGAPKVADAGEPGVATQPSPDQPVSPEQPTPEAMFNQQADKIQSQLLSKPNIKPSSGGIGEFEDTGGDLTDGISDLMDGLAAGEGGLNVFADIAALGAGLAGIIAPVFGSKIHHNTPNLPNMTPTMAFGVLPQ